MSSDCLGVKAFLWYQPCWMIHNWSLAPIQVVSRRKSSCSPDQGYLALTHYRFTVDYVCVCVCVCVCLSMQASHRPDFHGLTSERASLGKICCPWRDQREIFINHLHNKYWTQPERSQPFGGHPHQKCANTSQSPPADPSQPPWNCISDPLIWLIYHTHCSDLLIPTRSLWDGELLLAGRSNVNMWSFSDETTSSFRSQQPFFSVLHVLFIAAVWPVWCHCYHMNMSLTCQWCLQFPLDLLCSKCRTISIFPLSKNMVDGG